MSEGYNSRLSKKPYKGLCGDEEKYDSPEDLRDKIAELVTMVQESTYTVAHTGCYIYLYINNFQNVSSPLSLTLNVHINIILGAGISTSCGIPDFRGPKGVWTLEEKGLPAPKSTSFESAIPSLTHMSLVGLMQAQKLRYIVSQNVDGLHLRSGIPRENLSELHGNIFTEECPKCRREYLRPFDTQGMALKPTGRLCVYPQCGGALIDRICDWTSILPPDEFDRAVLHHRKAQLAICLGTSLRIRPAGNLPLRTTRKNGKPEPGKLVIINLQATDLDRHADLRIWAKVDDVMKGLLEGLKLKIPEYVKPIPLPNQPDLLLVTDLKTIDPDPDVNPNFGSSQNHTSITTSSSSSSSCSSSSSSSRACGSKQAEAKQPIRKKQKVKHETHNNDTNSASVSLPVAPIDTDLETRSVANESSTSSASPPSTHVKPDSTTPVPSSKPRGMDMWSR